MSRIVELGKEYRQRGGLEARVFMVLPVSTNFAVLGAYRGNDGEWYPGNWMSDGRLTRSGPTPLDLIESQTEVTMTTTPEQIESVAKRLLQHFLFLYLDKNHDPYEWENLPQVAQDRLREIANDSINAMRPFIRDEVLEEAAKVAEGPVKRRSLVTGEVIYRGDDEHDYAVDGSSDYGAGRIEAAAAIRALKGKNDPQTS